LIGADLDLRGCTSLTSLPKRLKVDGNIDLENTPIADKYTEEEIRKMCYIKMCDIKGKIYF